MKDSIKLPYTLLKVEGPDASKFLQGQLSCDLEALDESTWTYGTANTPKGRIYWLFVIAKFRDSYWIRVHTPILESGLATLKKYMVFFKCEITIMEHFQVLGVYAKAGVTKDKEIISENEGTYSRKVDASSGRIEVWQDIRNRSVQAEPVNEEHSLIEKWFADDCKAGIPEIYPETQEQFVLQQINLQDLGAVSFNKGCYTGQEIIARMKFLGKLKKKMYLITSQDTVIDTEPSVKPSDKLVDPDGKKVGEIVRCHGAHSGFAGLAVCDIAAIESRTSINLDNQTAATIAVTELHYN